MSSSSHLFNEQHVCVCFFSSASQLRKSPSCSPGCACSPNQPATRSRSRSHPRAQTSSMPVTSWRTLPWPTDSTTSPAPRHAPTPSPTRCLGFLSKVRCVCITQISLYRIKYNVSCLYIYSTSSHWINWRSCWDKTWQLLDSQRPSTLPW